MNRCPSNGFITTPTAPFSFTHGIISTAASRSVSGRTAGPAQASLGLLPSLRHPAVPRLAERAVQLRALRHVADPERVVEYLDVHAEPVHVREPERDVVEGACLLGCHEVASRRSDIAFSSRSTGDAGRSPAMRPSITQ